MRCLVSICSSACYENIAWVVRHGWHGGSTAKCEGGSPASFVLMGQVDLSGVWLECFSMFPRGQE